MISLADKLHNARAILADVRQIGEQAWGRFNVPKAKQLWYYRALADTFLVLQPGFLADELKRTVTEVEHLTAS